MYARTHNGNVFERIDLVIDCLIDSIINPCQGFIFIPLMESDQKCGNYSFFLIVQNPSLTTIFFSGGLFTEEATQINQGHPFSSHRVN